MSQRGFLEILEVLQGISWGLQGHSKGIHEVSELFHGRFRVSYEAFSEAFQRVKGTFIYSLSLVLVIVSP